MKYRIVKDGNGKFRVQYKIGFLSEWDSMFVTIEDYPDSLNKEWRDSEYYIDYNDGVFSSMDLARKKLDKLLEIRRRENLAKNFTVMHEVKV